jgi:PqqD family protein of HPr-rel-A system
MMMASTRILYRAEAQDQRRMEALDDLVLIYQRRSGITHLVAEPVPQILSALGSDALSPAALLTRLLGDYDLETSDDAVEKLTARLEELADLGLVERLSDA